MSVEFGQSWFRGLLKVGLQSFITNPQLVMAWLNMELGRAFDEF
jgi:hypothetical protein